MSSGGAGTVMELLGVTAIDGESCRRDSFSTHSPTDSRDLDLSELHTASRGGAGDGQGAAACDSQRGQAAGDAPM